MSWKASRGVTGYDLGFKTITPAAKERIDDHKAKLQTRTSVSRRDAMAQARVCAVEVEE